MEPSTSSKPDLFQALKDDKECEERPKMPNLGIEDRTIEKESNLDSADDNKDSGDELDFMKGECSKDEGNDRKRKLDKQTRKEIEEEEREKML